MKTIYDLVSLVAFAGLAILFLQRSASSTPDRIAIWKYGVAAVGCALADWLGNNDMPIPSVVTFVALAIFTFVVLKPLQTDERKP